MHLKRIKNMPYKINKYITGVALWMMFFVYQPLVKAQFDNKITFNAFLGSGLPLGASIDADSIPYVFSNFTYVLQAGAGVQYNFNPQFSLGISAGGFTGVRYKNPIPTPAGKEDIIEQESKNYRTSYFVNYNIGLVAKYKFMQAYKVNPYLFLEPTINYYSGEIAPRLEYYKAPTIDQTPAPEAITDTYTILRFNSKQIPATFAFGFIGGAGVDIKLSDTFTYMFQTCYQWVATGSDGNLKKPIHIIAVQTGLRFSFIRSKSIL